VKLMSDSFPGNGLQDEYLVLLQFTCAAVVLCLFWPILNVLRSISVSVDFRLLFLVAVFALSCFVYVVLTLDTPNNMTIFVTDAQAKCAPTIWPYSNRTSLPFSYSFTRTGSAETIINVLARALQSVKWKNIQCCQLKLFHYSQHRLSSVS
jgi:predicted PurR-regulated permease PerM